MATLAPSFTPDFAPTGPFPIVEDFDCHLFDRLERIHREVKRGSLLSDAVNILGNTWIRDAYRDGLLTEASLRAFFEGR